MPLASIRQAQEVLGATANGEVMMREDGGRDGWSPEALELAWVGKRVPQALLRNGIGAHHDEGERCGILGDKGQRYRQFHFGTRTTKSYTLQWRQMESKNTKNTT